MKSLSVLKPYNVSHTKSCKLEPLSANLQGPCLVVSQTHQLVRRIKAINSSVLKNLYFGQKLLKSCSKKQTELLEVASTEKRCSKRQKLLKSCQAQSGHANPHPNYMRVPLPPDLATDQSISLPRPSHFPKSERILGTRLISPMIWRFPLFPGWRIWVALSI